MKRGMANEIFFAVQGRLAACILAAAFCAALACCDSKSDGGSDQCGDVCSKLADLCGGALPGCQAFCEGLSLEQRVCVMNSTSCNAAGACTSEECMCDAEEGCDIGCDCDPECGGCTCNTTGSCDSGCTCDPDCSGCTCNTTGSCDSGCTCDPDCSGCTCNTSGSCDADCSCDPDCSTLCAAPGAVCDLMSCCYEPGKPLLACVHDTTGSTGYCCIMRGESCDDPWVAGANCCNYIPCSSVDGGPYLCQE